MRYLKSIVAFATLIFAASCAVDNIDMPSAKPDNGDQITIMGRITRFDDYEVSTRGVKHGDEGKITSMALAIFKLNDTEDGLAGNCEYYFHSASQQELLITITRGDLFEKGERYAMYVFCNMPGMGDFESGYFKDGDGGTSLADMLAKAYSVTDLNIPENGFPMIGSLGDTFSENIDKDGKEFILSPVDSNGDLTLPTINGTESDFLTIPMKAIYAKVNFSIAVDPDQTIEGNYTPQFSINSYTLCNVTTSVTFNKSTNSVGKTDEVGESVVKDLPGLKISGNQEAVGASTIDFSFYLPERLLTPATSADEYEYPFVKGTYSTQVDSDGNGYRDEDEKYFQRYKSKLVSDDQRATHICIEGTYRDHQNHEHNVAYTIYLGKDNYSDFNILRNGEYFNYVTIRGIQNTDDMSNKDGAVSIDHRVEVDRTEQPAIISLRREVLLDSHFEVRPLRIRKSDVANIPNDITHVKVEVVNPTTTNWMRLERSFGEGGDGAGKDIYIKEGVSAGKRKYFTFDLITGSNDTTNGDLAPLTESTEVIVPLNDEEQCVWIYVDECTEVGDEVRAGIVKVTYGNDNGTKFTPTTDSTYPAVSYVINQRKLFEVKYDDPSTTADENRKYHIEYEEEYLHNFDADDNYGQTEYEGMQWGLPGIQLSYDNDALYFDSSGGLVDSFFTRIINWIKSNAGVNPQYDFYIPKHDTSVSRQAKKRDFRGYVFSSEIINVVNGQDNHDTDTSNNIDVLQLDEKPDSAIEYCYNKNKRNRNGQVAWTGNSDNHNWYLPAIDEIEDIVMSKYGENNTQYTYARFIEFQTQYYWSSQPSYIRNHAYYDIWNTVKRGKYYIDDDSHARSTSVSYNVNTQNFDYVLSGTTSDYNGISIGGYNPLNPDVTLYTSGTLDGVVLGTIVREPGNQPRTEKNRIRCVRKSQYTNTKVD